MATKAQSHQVKTLCAFVALWDKIRPFCPFVLRTPLFEGSCFGLVRVVLWFCFGLYWGFGSKTRIQ